MTLRCLSPDEAALLVKLLPRTSGSSVTIDPRDRDAITIQGTPEQVQRVRTALTEHEALAACTVRPAPPAAP